MHMSMGIVVVMRVARQMAELFLVIPTQKRHVGEKLVSVVCVSSVVVYAHLKLGIFLE